MQADYVQADYVIVGAGSAGCVLANRLSADPSNRVILIEAGGRDWNPLIHIPAGYVKLLDHPKLTWGFTAEPDPGVNNRAILYPRGRVLGGSSSINGMAYVRGHARDYDRWAQTGLPGWDYAHVLPYFKRAETRERGADDYRGGDGPLHVATGACRNPLYQAFIEAGRQAGYPLSADMNGYQQEGLAPMDMTVRGGRRWSAARAYLDPARRRPNLTVRTGALVRRVRCEGGRAVGVEYAKGRHAVSVRAEREVILAGGAINSPQLLMLSGIGDADELDRFEIPRVAHLPGVGRNLQDHLEIYVQHACTRPISLYAAQRPWQKARIGLEWILLKRGLGATSHFEAGAFIRSRAGIEHPDLQYHFLPIAVNYDGSNPQKTHGFQAHVGPMRPTSAGRVSLRSADRREPPSILFNYMATEGDRQEMRAAVRLTREIFAQRAFDPYLGPELAPGAEVDTDAEIDAFVRARAESAYHPCGTCKMGPDSDSSAVVDGACRVHGIEGLRVVDASVMPSITSGNLNAPTIMLAEKAADLIRGRPPLDPLDVPVHIAPDWAKHQR
jgi:choline dehydrogenase